MVAQKGDEAAAKGKHQQAKKKFEEAEKLDPDNKDAKEWKNKAIRRLLPSPTAAPTPSPTAVPTLAPKQKAAKLVSEGERKFEEGEKAEEETTTAQTQAK